MAAGALAAGIMAGPVPAAADAQQACPAVAVVAARGSDQNVDLEPTSYAPDSPWVSNGFEGPHLTSFLQFAQARHQAQTGQSLLRDVPVLALDDVTYPAAMGLPELAAPGEEVTPLEMARRVGEVLRVKPAHQYAVDALHTFEGSVRSGVDNALGYIDAWEAESGCTPGYILLGYSQGAVVLTAQEQALQERGQLVGSLYLGNPLLRTTDAAVVGAPDRGAGMLSSAPVTAADSTRLNYCTAGDFSCDLTSSAALASLGDGGGAHTQYFVSADTDPTEYDDHVADTFAGWITGYTPGP